MGFPVDRLGPALKRRGRHDLRQRLLRLERPGVAGYGGEDSEWLTDAEFEEYAELRRSGAPVEATDCQRLLAVARGRRARREPKPNDLWRVDVAEGRPTVIPRLSDEEVDRLAAESRERNSPRGQLVERGDGNFNWGPVESRHF